MKHKNGKNGRGGLLCIYTKETQKTLLHTLPKKGWKCPFYKALKEKENINIMKKGREG